MDDTRLDTFFEEIKKGIDVEEYLNREEIKKAAGIQLDEGNWTILCKATGQLLCDKSYAMPPRKELLNTILSAIKKSAELMDCYEKITPLCIYYARIFSSIDFEPKYADKAASLFNHAREMLEVTSRMGSINEFLPDVHLLLPGRTGGRRTDLALQYLILKIYPLSLLSGRGRHRLSR